MHEDYRRDNNDGDAKEEGKSVDQPTGVCMDNLVFQVQQSITPEGPAHTWSYSLVIPGPQCHPARLGQLTPPQASPLLTATGINLDVIT